MIDGQISFNILIKTPSTPGALFAFKKWIIFISLHS